MKKILLIITIILKVTSLYAQPKITTTGNNIIDIHDPYAADVVIGSDAGVRHDASIMWWSNGSASRISNTDDVFKFSIWNTENPNIALAAGLGAPSYFMGNVGIGTTTPSERLQVSGRVLANYLASKGNIGIGSDVDARIYMQNTTPQTGKNWNLISETDGSFQLGIYGINPFQTIASNGNVGIGTTTPDAKLAVKGTIHTQEVKVDMNGWADYVFNPTYKMLPLDQVKAYISSNHHLPEMPSETEVKLKGVNIGEMLKLQTKKIEELTLYLLQQQTRINKLESKLRISRKVNRRF